jgi:hypothetical protein
MSQGISSSAAQTLYFIRAARFRLPPLGAGSAGHQNGQSMSPERPAQPDSAAPPAGAVTQSAPRDDVPIDAIVYDVHPALLPPAAPTAPGPVYPYGPGGGVNPFQIRTAELNRPLPLEFGFSFEVQTAPADYVVPQRFGISAILGITTALALMFGAMHWLNAEPVWYLFLGMLSIVICLVQMFNGKTPRAASAIAGAIMAPVFCLGWAFFAPNIDDARAVLCLLIFAVPCGAGLGYLTGTCAAGVFLVMDALEPYLQGKGFDRPASATNTQVPT